MRACLFASIRGRDLYDLMTSDVEPHHIEMNEDDSGEIDVTCRINGFGDGREQEQYVVSDTEVVNGEGGMESGERHAEQSVTIEQVT